jgi:two-component system, chemotaxis family, protein-glutamate methylesterase/glutaminase
MPTRVLIVDDSRIFRAVLEASLADAEGIEVVGSVFSGAKAIEFIRAHRPDVVTLDVEMPGIDGLESLRAIRQLDASAEPGAEIGVIMVSAYTTRGADVTVQALRDGAFDFITKPSAAQSSNENPALLRQHLLSKIRLFIAERARRALTQKSSPTAIANRNDESAANRSRWLGNRSRAAIRAIVIASSTGGPKALERLLPDLVRRVDVPILIVQHMPPKFTASLAASLERTCQTSVAEARDGDLVKKKSIYLAPGGQHLVVRREHNLLVLALNEQPPENGCRPSADVLFRSAATVFEGGAAAIVLTGMGRDGTAGLGAIKRAGGYAFVQDEATSVVWGMPGSAVEAGLADEILPLDGIAAAVESLIGEASTDCK